MSNKTFKEIGVPKGERRSGTTTRLVDSHIQELFSKGEVYCKDHYGSAIADRLLFKRVESRMRYEHKHVNIKCDISKCLIRIIE
ncbi:hypothetical protein [Flammeovirga sp. OC4]|uniref:hypothetical protein n=1 Tax=Flammeovirga sp. OC4 TaxID=1382345 RepID=UPI0005C70668|nr:hypothetical protein [Flammeovirga sp. OC4]